MRKTCQEGIIVALHSRTSAEVGAALTRELAGTSYTAADLSSACDAKRLISAVLEQHGHIDILVNNAGISEVIPHHDLKAATPEIWHRLYALNVVAPWVLIGEAERSLRKAAQLGSTGCVINISSHAGLRPKGASIPYAVSKASLNHMTKMLAVTLAPEIRVNAIAPGLVDTPMTHAWQEAHDLWRAKSPMKRGASPMEIADIALMLANSTYLTGEVIMADGGLNLT